MHNPTLTVCDTDNLAFSTDIQAFLLLAYVDGLKENDGYSIRIHAGVASCMVSACGSVRKMAISNN